MQRFTVLVLYVCLIPRAASLHRWTGASGPYTFLLTKIAIHHKPLSL
jgi:hypothetical protein